jgi:hypothetical protein
MHHTSRYSGRAISRRAFKKLRERPGIGMRQQQRGGVGLLGSDMNEVHGLAVDLGDEARYGVHPVSCAPVELLPGSYHLLQVGDRRPVIPAVIAAVTE